MIPTNGNTSEQETLADIVISELEKVIDSQFLYIQGPAWHPDGYLLFTDISGNRWRRERNKRLQRDMKERENLQLFNQPSILVFDREGRLISCEKGNRRITRLERDDTLTVITDHYKQRKFNGPHDCVFRSDGTLFFTDPTLWYKMIARYKTIEPELDYRGIYRIEPESEPYLLADDFEQPNGVALAPDEKTLYVSDSDTGEIRAYRIRENDALAEKKTIALLPYPQGIKVDTKGHLYVACQKGIAVLNADGSAIGIIEVPEMASNSAFGDFDMKTLYITAWTSLYKVRLKHQGLIRWQE
jgi:sugar lactone lactonase YvrE